MPEAIEEASFRVEADEAGERLDAFLARRHSGLSRSRLKAVVKDGGVRIDGLVVTDPNRRVAAGGQISMAIPAPVDAEPAPEAIALDIVYEDDAVIVIDKPAGLVVHPGAGNWTGTLVNALIHHCGDSLSGIGGVRRPGIVHRLDKDTTGLLVVAKTDRAHSGLAAQFADHGVEGPLIREYRALVWGSPRSHIGTVETNLDRDTRNRQKQAVTRAGGRRALTHYRVVQSGTAASLLACTLETGRTHQIRVHMAHIGHPLVGDTVYGSGFLTKADSLGAELRDAVKAFRRQALHAGILGFAHPLTGEALRFESPMPGDMADLCERFGVQRV